MGEAHHLSRRMHRLSLFCAVLLCLLLSMGTSSGAAAGWNMQDTRIQDEQGNAWASHGVDSTSMVVEWHLPVGCDWSGFFVEMLGYLPGLERRVKKVILNSGKCGQEMLGQLPEAEAGAVMRSQSHSAKDMEAGRLVVQHSEPCTWKSAAQYPVGSRPLAVIGRTMTEVVPSQKDMARIAECSQRVDMVWLPTAFHAGIFERAGVHAHRIRVVPESVDSEFFSPSPTPRDREDFTFISIFKWEHRKGWDLLLDAYWAEFHPSERVLLRLVAYIPSWEVGPKDVNTRIAQHAAVSSPRRRRAWSEHGRGVRGEETPSEKDFLSAAPRVVVEPGGGKMTRAGVREAYAEADCFVLPTRGEGWGLPIVEAMSMGLPTIATNWSGPTGFMSDEIGYPLSYEEVTAGQDGPTAAEPSLKHLMQLMRRVYTERGEAAERGRRAREHVSQVLSPERVVEGMVEGLAQAVSRAREGTLAEQEL